MKTYIKKYPLVSILIALIVLVGLLIGMNQRSSTSTPEGVALEFVKAVQADDMVRAYDLVSIDIKSEYKLSEFKTRDVDGDAFYYFKGDPSNVQVSKSGSQAVVHFTATVYRSQRSEKAESKDLSLSLIKEDEGWRVSDFDDLTYYIL